MKRNLFKKLAFLMALTLVVTAIAPAAAANAAAKPNLNATSKTLYVGKSYNFNVKNKVKKSTYKWSTSDKAVATVNAKNGVAKAVAPGTATISCKITLPTKKTTTLKATVTVKQDATAVKINNPVESVKVGDASYQFKRGITPKTSTNKTFYVIDADSNTAEAVAVNDKGVINVAKTGEFKIKAVTARGKVQFAAGNWKAESEWLTVKVPLTIDAKLTAVNKMELSFNDKVELTVDDIEVRESETKLRQPIKSVTASDDGKSCVVEFHSTLTNDKTYNVTAKEATAQFKAIIGEISKIVMTDKNIITNTATAIDYMVLDENGLDITTKYPISGMVVDYSAGSVTNGKLTLYNEGDVALVKLTYVQYSTDGTDKSVSSEEVKYTAVKTTVNKITKWYIANEDPNGWEYLNNETVKLEDTNYFIMLQTTNSAGKQIRSTSSSHGFSPTSVNQNGFEFESLYNDILMVDRVTGQLFPVKTGKADVKVTNKDDDSFVTYLSVEVQAKREAKSLDISTASFKLSNAQTVEELAANEKSIDSRVVTITVKDQYGATFTKATNEVKAQVLTGDKDIVEAYAISTSGVIGAVGDSVGGDAVQVGTLSNGVEKINFAPIKGKKGSTTIKITAGDFYKIVNINVVEPGTGTTYAIDLKTIKTGTTTLVSVANAKNALGMDDISEIQNYNPYNGSQGLVFAVYAKDSSGARRSVVSSGAVYNNTSTTTAIWDANYTIKNSSGDIVTFRQDKNGTAATEIKADKLPLPGVVMLNALASQLPQGKYTITVELTDSVRELAGAKKTTITKSFEVVSEKPNATVTINNVKIDYKIGDSITIADVIDEALDVNIVDWTGQEQVIGKSYPTILKAPLSGLTTDLKSVKYISNSNVGLENTNSKTENIDTTEERTFTVRITELVVTLSTRDSAGSSDKPYEFTVKPNVEITIVVK